MYVHQFCKKAVSFSYSYKSDILPKSRSFNLSNIVFRLYSVTLCINL